MLRVQADGGDVRHALGGTPAALRAVFRRRTRKRQGRD